MLVPTAAAIILIAAAPTHQKIDRRAQSAAIDYARQLLADRLDPALPAIRLDKWLEQAIGDTAMEWFVSDCDLKMTGLEPPEEVLLCIGARQGEHGSIYLRFHLAVGDWAHGVIGDPSVLPQSFVGCNPLKFDANDSMPQSLDKLSELPAIVGKLRDTCPRGE